MELIFSIVRVLHIIGGFTALFVFWIPIVTKKGGKVHNTVGWIYVYGMIVVAVSAFYMGFYKIFFDPSASNEDVSFSWFLIFISILSSASAYYGLRVLRFKTRKKPHTHLLDITYPTLLLTSGIGISIYGFFQHSPLLSWFPILGIFLGLNHLLYWLQKPKRNMHWLFEHFAGMLACSISTLTAFIVFGAPRLLNIESVNVFLWFLPTIVITPLIIALGIYYGRKYNKPKN
ncbi:DUF2306 domain-containing protein [Metabacillus sediminilitoris]|uniref:DUF2306 domain-containing protein n=1 Tax=Metabacillus sediminilitoris TaxID=2567941 RepID=A0A4S4C5Q6_9BACI|nr:DUF2306 domain-containing protein [Metabacillus sediminilitoris]QGQ47033.1 DUF2306 domain-containing protein [Metabacillus sediminilitoris]THF83179.1 DUF2306 domain-containing protein [Metabacillus sediminilitoris]